MDRDISRHSPSHTSKPVNFIPSSSCWQNLSHSFQPKSRHAKADALDSTPHQPSFLREAPDEILDIILLHSVRGHQDLHKLSLTCRRWRDFSCDDQPWKRLAVRAWGSRSDIVQVPIKKDAQCTVSWKEYYCNRIRSHLPELSYMMNQQNMTVSIRYAPPFLPFLSRLLTPQRARNQIAPQPRPGVLEGREVDAAKRIFSLPHRTPVNHAQPASLSHSSCVHPHVVNFVFVFAATD